ncbi:MAG: PAS domain-containing protein [Oscillatoriales cyanobacterium SM2_1_8]|nr:PAS domain-containing protein [Oscillatoriales cyanobacterium SM2_1_8]
MVLVYISHLETELRKSKAFLQSIIDTIADPVFVKDDRHCWIVLNQAFCEFIGQPRQHLLNRREADFFILMRRRCFAGGTSRCFNFRKALKVKTSSPMLIKASISLPPSDRSTGMPQAMSFW